MSRADGRDEADARDRMLFEQGRADELLARYHDDIRSLVTLRLPRDLADDRDDVVQAVLLRLLREIARGTPRVVPFRVLVHQRCGWAVDRQRVLVARERARVGAELDDDGRSGEPRSDDPYRVVELTMSLREIFATLAPADREAAEGVWLVGESIASLARRTGRSRNAVDQSLARARRRLREELPRAAG